MSRHRFFRRRRADAELQEEMNVHLAAEIEENLARGYSRTGSTRGSAQIRKSATAQGAALAPEYNLLARQPLAQSEIQLSRSAQIARIRGGFDRGDRSRHRCERCIVHSGAQRVAEAAAVRQSAEAGAAV